MCIICAEVSACLRADGTVSCSRVQLASCSAALLLKTPGQCYGERSDKSSTNVRRNTTSSIRWCYEHGVLLGRCIVVEAEEAAN